MNQITQFSRRHVAISLDAGLTKGAPGDLHRFLSAFVGGFIFFSILLL